MKIEFAWPTGDRPGDLSFQYQPHPSVVRSINGALSSFFPLVDLANARYDSIRPMETPVGRYRLSTPQGAWFVRVTSWRGDPPMEKSLTDFLAERGVRVNQLLVARKTFEWEGRSYFIDVRPFIDGRHFNGSPEDLQTLAVTLSSCHRALAEFPYAHQIRAAAAARGDRLGKVRDGIVESLRRGTFELFAKHEAWAAEHRDWLAEMAEHFEPRLDGRPDAQCVHGEIHPGNVLFRKGDDAAVLLDFEQSPELFVPAAWDIAFLLQRFCFWDHPSASRARERLAIVADAYGAPLGELVPMMRQAAWSLMATIVDWYMSYGVVMPVEECEKCVKLERLTVAYADFV